MAQKNTCDCPQPPGGRVVCESHQLAICRVIEGELQMLCVDVPGRHARLLDLPPDQRSPLYNWVLSQVMGVRRSDSAALGDEELEVLQEGRYEARGIVVNFRLPRGRSDGDTPLAPSGGVDWGFGAQPGQPVKEWTT